jgi:hypothetical protein
MKRTFIALFAVLALAGCSDDNNGGGGNGDAALNETQTTTVASTIQSALVQAGMGGMPARISSPRTATEIPYSDIEVACSVGGNVTVDGTVTVNDTDFTIQANETFNACQETGDDDVVYTMNGGPIVTTGTYSFEAASATHFTTTFQYDTSGALDVTGGDVNVTDCAIELTLNVTIDVVCDDEQCSGGTITASGNYGGNVCGTTIDTVTFPETSYTL